MTDYSMKDQHSAGGAAPLPARRPYARPQIAWREAYEPVAFGASCAQQPGNPGCQPGPLTA